MLKSAIGLFVITTIILVAFLPSFTTMMEKREKNLDYDAKIEALKKKQIDLVEERRLLKDDPVYLEKVAREKMGLVREGEVIYRIESNTIEKK